MTTRKKSASGVILSFVLMFGVAACQGKQSSNAATQSISQNDQGDPAAANNAPVGSTPVAAQSQSPASSNQSYAPQPAAPAEYSQNEPPPPPDQAGGYAEGSYDDTADQQPVYAPEPPPPLPEYEQPYCPGDGYIWTPGYWYWSPAGYYWVPGAWVLAPWVGALWTPGYWGFVGNRYSWHPGYWGQYIGFYGGVNYGYGYFGTGYEGGYWNHGAFYYNRSITRVNGNIHRVYARNVNYNNRTRVSYNGGRGGLNARPNQSQLKASRSRRFGALPAQRQLAQQAHGNRSQFAKVNKGKPAQTAFTRPVNGGRKTPAARPQDVHLAAGTRPANGARAAKGAHRGNTTRSAPHTSRTATGHPKPSPERSAQGNRSATRPVHQTRPESRPAHQAHPEQRPEARPAQQRPESRSTPQRRPESRPAPQRQEARPAPQRHEARPAPQHREAKPAPRQQDDNRH